MIAAAIKANLVDLYPPSNTSAQTYLDSATDAEASAETGTMATVDADSTELAIPPLTKYLTAMSIYQEVKLLDKYLDHAALRHDYDPYLVRLQVGVSPRSRNLPYDAISTISFFNNDDGCENPIVIPLIVTDSLEYTQATRSTRDALSLAIGIGAMMSKAKVSGSLSSITEELNTYLGRDSNSLFSISRFAPNTILARFGAETMGADAYELVPKTHQVSLLVLVKNKQCGNFTINSNGIFSQVVDIVARADFYNALSGERVDCKTMDSVIKGIKLKIKDIFGVNIEKCVGFADTEAKSRIKAKIQEVMHDIYRNDYKNYNENITSLLNTCTNSSTADISQEMRQAFWATLNAYHSDSPFSYSKFEVRSLPKLDFAQVLLPDKNSAISVIDNGSTIQATLKPGYNLDEAIFTAKLALKRGENNYINFYADSIEVTSDGLGFVLTFPSPKKYDIDIKSTTGHFLSLYKSNLINSTKPASYEGDDYRIYPMVSYQKADSATSEDPSIVLSRTSEYITISKKVCRFKVTIKPENSSKKFLLKIAGGYITDIQTDEKNAVTKNGEELSVTKSTYVSLTLDNIVVGENFTITSYIDNVKKGSLAFTVKEK